MVAIDDIFYDQTCLADDGHLSYYLYRCWVLRIRVSCCHAERAIDSLERIFDVAIDMARFSTKGGRKRRHDRDTAIKADCFLCLPWLLFMHGSLLGNGIAEWVKTCFR